MVLWLVLGALATVIPPAEGEHEVDHRYVVLGYVRDVTGRPVAGQRVEVVRERTGLAYRAETDASGFYVAIAHLHDEDVLDGLRVTAGRAMIRIEARFNPTDPKTPRGTRLDFTAAAARERPEAFADTLANLLKR